MAVEQSTVRRARKQHPCSDPWCHVEVIEPGTLYVEHVVSPGHPEVENQRWRRNKECALSYHERTGETLVCTGSLPNRKG